MTLEVLTDHDLAAATRLLAEHGAPTPQWITVALDWRGLYGPQVDQCLGVVEPAVDQWETGELVPTAEQLARLAALVELDVAFFFRPARGPVTGWVCIRSGPGRGCHRIDTGNPVAKPADRPAQLQLNTPGATP
jgi:transcriptional regulator with XRE-family HTH domain